MRLLARGQGRKRPLTSSGGGDHDDDGAADLDLVALLQALGRVHAAVVEPGAVGRAEVLDEPVAVGQLEQGVVAGGVLVIDDQAALPAGGELGVEGADLVAGLDDDRMGGGSLGEGGFTRARHRGDNGPPGLLLLVADVLPGREGVGMGSPVGIVGGPCETVEIGTSHQSIMPEQRGDDAAGGGGSGMIVPWTFPYLHHPGGQPSHPQPPDQREAGDSGPGRCGRAQSRAGPARPVPARVPGLGRVRADGPLILGPLILGPLVFGTLVFGMLSRASAAAARVTRLATAAVAVRPAAWARTGPAAAPARVAAASPVRNTAPIRPRSAFGITRCMAVCGTTRDMEPNVPTAAAAGSALLSDDEVNSAKNAAAVAVRVAASRGPGWTESSSRRMTGAPSRKPVPRPASRKPVCSLPPSRWIPNGMSTALSEALAARKTTVTSSSARATGWPSSTRAPPARSRATVLIVVPVAEDAPSAGAPGEVMNMAA